MKNTDYINLSTNIKVHEKRLIDGPGWNRLIEAKDSDDFFSILQDTRYGDLLKESKSRKEFDRALDEELINIYRDFYDRSPNKDIIEILAADYLFHNLKVVLKSYLLDKNLSNLYIELRDQDLDQILDDLKEEGRVKEDRNFSYYVNFALDIYNKTKDPKRMEMALDRFKNEYILELVQKLDIGTIESYVKNLIDIQNLDMVFRSKNENSSINKVAQFLTRGGNISIDVLIDNYFEDLGDLLKALRPYNIYKILDRAYELYEEDEDMSHFRDFNHAYLFDIVKQGSKVTFGPEIIFSYILRIENEIKALRITNIAKLNNMDFDELKKRVENQIA